jgi:uncharacterized membrane protein
MSRALLAAFLALTALTACEDDPPPPSCPEEHEHEGTPSGAACNGSTLTYENFGQMFMEAYCTRCHSSELTGEARNCAPSDHNFDTLDEIVLYRDHIDEAAAAGPDSVNEAMPPSGAKPTSEERQNLGIWLACENERQ